MPATAPPTGQAGAAPDAALAGLAGLAGLAPSAVLRGRLDRAAALLRRLPPGRPDEDDPAWAALLDAVTVQETRLFRHPDQLALLRGAALPDLAAAAAREGRKLRLLSAGCATGEEAWTLGMLALDAAGPGGAEVQVTGLDLCRPALAAATAARYAGPPDPLRDVPPEHRSWLEGEVTGPRAVVWPGPALRRAVTFRRANLLRLAEPADSFDVVLCRNVLIYLTPVARRAVLARLTAALRPGGALLLGSTDTAAPELGLRPWKPGMVGLLRREGARAG